MITALDFLLKLLSSMDLQIGRNDFPKLYSMGYNKQSHLKNFPL